MPDDGHQVLYKLTNANGMTRGCTVWKIGVPAPRLYGTKLCAPGIYHAYEDPFVAVLMDPLHADYGTTARMFVCDAPGVVVRDNWLKCGVQTMTPRAEVLLPRLSTTTRVEIAIRLALEVQENGASEKFAVWAASWLAGRDRSKQAAAEVAEAEAAAAAAARAVWAPARAAARAEAAAAAAEARAVWAEARAAAAAAAAAVWAPERAAAAAAAEAAEAVPTKQKTLLSIVQEVAAHA